MLINSITNFFFQSKKRYFKKTKNKDKQEVGGKK